MSNPSQDPMLLDSTGQAIVGALDDIKTAIENGGGGGGGSTPAWLEPADYDSSVARYGSNIAYVVGEYCKESGKIYRANVNISKDELFTSGHWVEITDLFAELSRKPGMRYYTALNNGGFVERFNDVSSNNAVGPNSHAEGSSTTASGTASHAEGTSTTASGAYSHAEGYGTKASNDTSHAEGQSTTASGYKSHAEGDGSTASGASSHAEGNYTTAVGEGSHVEGGSSSTGSSAKYAHAEGDQCSANGRASHAEGSMNTAGGYASHAGGQDCYVGGNYSFASGLGLSVNVPNSAAVGKYNVASSSSDTNPILFAVGNGTRPVGGQPVRSNAFEAYQDGTCKAGGQKIIAIDPPTTDGTYKLQCTVSNGVPTYAWVADA